MSDLSVVAKPYAEAVFNIAVADGSFAKWSTMLKDIVTVAADPRVVDLIENPQVDDLAIAQLIIDICASPDNALAQNFVQLVAENHRLLAITDICAIFEYLRQEHEKVLDVQVTSRFGLSDEQQQRLQQALAKRFQKQIDIEFDLDENLLGGALIRIRNDNTVIDGSARNKLALLSQHLQLKERV